jgi:hypothetical protein
MSQTSIIAGALVIAYIVYVTVKGELPAYLSMLGIGGSCASTPSGCNPCASTTTPSQPPATQTGQPAGGIGPATGDPNAAAQ